MTNILGRCSQCGSVVIQPPGSTDKKPWVPTCTSCGATARLPVIDMEKSVGQLHIERVLDTMQKAAITKKEPKKRKRR